MDSFGNLNQLQRAQVVVQLAAHLGKLRFQRLHLALKRANIHRIGRDKSVNVASDVQIKVVPRDLFRRDPAAVSFFLDSPMIRVGDLRDIRSAF
jgi:hypothetical protein